MGFYDRDYYRSDSARGRLPRPRTMVGWLVLANVIVFVADGLSAELFFSGRNLLNDWLACRPDTLYRPWLWWQFLTYGFVHAPFGSEYQSHILWNMLSLWFLGPPVEQRYGGREFLRFYLVAIVLCGVLGSAAGLLGPAAQWHSLIGASGAVVAVVLLFIVNYPRQTLLLFFVLPVPAWLVGVLLVLVNLFGSQGYLDTSVAYGVHLVGLAFAGAYYYFGWNLSRLTGRWSLDWLKPRPRLRVHSPGGDDDHAEDKLNVEVDRILQKIHQQGEASLTKKERRTLEAASRRYQQNRRGS